MRRGEGIKKRDGVCPYLQPAKCEQQRASDVWCTSKCCHLWIWVEKMREKSLALCYFMQKDWILTTVSVPYWFLAISRHQSKKKHNANTSYWMLILHIVVHYIAIYNAIQHHSMVGISILPVWASAILLPPILPLQGSDQVEYLGVFEQVVVALSQCKSIRWTTVWL